jgi:hypothetical protein
MAEGDIVTMPPPFGGFVEAASALPVPVIVEKSDIDPLVRFVGGALPWLAIGPDGEPITQATHNPAKLEVEEVQDEGGRGGDGAGSIGK